MHHTIDGTILSFMYQISLNTSNDSLSSTPGSNNWQSVASLRCQLILHLLQVLSLLYPQLPFSHVWLLLTSFLLFLERRNIPRTNTNNNIVAATSQTVICDWDRENIALLHCVECGSQSYCAECDEVLHRPPDKRVHKRIPTNQMNQVIFFFYIYKISYFSTFPRTSFLSHISYLFALLSPSFVSPSFPSLFKTCMFANSSIGWHASRNTYHTNHAVLQPRRFRRARRVLSSDTIIIVIIIIGQRREEEEEEEEREVPMRDRGYQGHSRGALHWKQVYT